MRRTTLLAILIAAVTIALCFALLWGLMDAIRQGSIPLCWPVYWLFLFMGGLLYVAVDQGLKARNDLKNNY